MVDSLAFLLSGGKCDLRMSPVMSLNVASDVLAAGLVRCRRCEAEGWVPATMQGYVATMSPVMRPSGAMTRNVAGGMWAAGSMSPAIYSHAARGR